MKPRPTPVAPGTSTPSLVWRSVAPSTEAARAVVRRFFDAVARESTTELAGSLVEDALFHRPNQPATSALQFWTRRFSAGDYTKHVVPHDVAIRVFDHESARALTRYRTTQLWPDPDEFLAVVDLPLAGTPTGSSAPWGTQLQLILLAGEDGWKVRALWEDYAGK